MKLFDHLDTLKLEDLTKGRDATRARLSLWMRDHLSEEDIARVDVMTQSAATAIAYAVCLTRFDDQASSDWLDVLSDNIVGYITASRMRFGDDRDD